MTPALDVLLWTVLPYVSFVALVGGTVWRYRYDKFGWTSRSSQLHESRLLRLASPVFHYALFLVLGGHVVGLLIPKELTGLLGVTDPAYHVVSLVVGTASGLAATAGLAVLLWRRSRTRAVRGATTVTDVVTFVLLSTVLLAGLGATVVDNGLRGPYDYRETIGPWVRDLVLLHPNPELVANAPLSYQVHTLLAMLLFVLWPFSRLVHAFSAPVHYLVRPYVVYRGRDNDRVGVRAPRRGWDSR